jgi:hypothetical protein
MPGRRGGPLRRLRAGDEYTADEVEEVELDGPEPDAAIVPEAEQVGDLDHEGAPDGGN